MQSFRRRFVLVLALAGVPALAPAADGTSQPPSRRPADPALVRVLQDHAWTLRSATDAAGAPRAGLPGPGAPFVLRFEGARLAAKGGCNTLAGGWRLVDGGTLRVERLAATRMACDPPLMAADDAMSAVLAQPLRATVEPGEPSVLRLASPDGGALVLAGERTPRSLYGAPRRVFLEVAPERVPCTPSPMPPTTCLQVRELRFDDKGLRVGEPGPWGAYYGEIRGFVHDPGLRTVLRIERYTRPRPPADASKHVDVLDLVVRSEVVKPK